jgi:hypothetical protein
MFRDRSSSEKERDMDNDNHTHIHILTHIDHEPCRLMVVMRCILAHVLDAQRHANQMRHRASRNAFTSCSPVRKQRLVLSLADCLDLHCGHFTVSTCVEVHQYIDVPGLLTFTTHVCLLWVWSILAGLALCLLEQEEKGKNFRKNDGSVVGLPVDHVPFPPFYSPLETLQESGNISVQA